MSPVLQNQKEVLKAGLTWGTVNASSPEPGLFIDILVAKISAVSMQKASPPFTETTLQPRLRLSTGVATAWDKTRFGELVTRAQTLGAW